MSYSSGLSILKKIKIATILGSLGIGFLGLALPVYGKKMGLSAVEIGGLVSLYSVGTLLIRPGIGWAMDRYGRKIFLVLSLMLFGLSMLVFALSVGITGIYAARILQAIGGAIFWIAAYTIAIDLSDGTDKAKKIGIVDESFARGGLFGSIIGFSLLSYFQGDNVWSVLFFIYAVLGFVGGGIVWYKVPETKPQDIVPQSGKFSLRINHQLIKPVLIILLNGIALSTTSIMSSPIPMLLLQDQYTTDIALLGAAYVPITILFSIMPSRVGKLSDKIGRVIPICGGLIMVGFATMLITVVHNYYWLILAWTIETAGISLLSPAQAVLLSDKTNRSASIGSTYGLYTFTRSLGLIIGPIFGSWLYSSYGITAFQISGSIILGSAMFAFWGLRGKENYAAGKPRCQKAQ